MIVLIIFGFGANNIMIISIARYVCVGHQVFLELAASKVGGPLGKWAAVSAIVLLKTCLRWELINRVGTVLA